MIFCCHRPFLAVGDVAFGDSNKPWRHLKGSKAELKIIESIIPNTECVVLRNEDATVARVIEELPKAKCVHLGTHGVYLDSASRRALGIRDGETISRRQPRLSTAIVFAGANHLASGESSEEAALTAEAIPMLSLGSTELVVLSSCDTALGVLQSGEYYSLQQAFHEAGVRNVVAALWKVKDSYTAAMMVLFYKYLHEHPDMSPAEALRSAQLHMY